MVIYSITNIVNGKRYISQTIRSINIRWTQHRNLLRNNRHPNIYLQRAWDKYGEDNFEFNQVITVNTQQELNELEEKYISFDKLNNNSYNIISGGTDSFPTEASHIRWSNPKYKIWRTETNIKLWADPEKKISMLSGLMPYATNSEWKSELGKKQWQRKEYRAKFEKEYKGFISPNGTIYSPVIGIRKFAKEHKLDPGSLIKVHNEKCKQHKGWVKYV